MRLWKNKTRPTKKVTMPVTVKQTQRFKSRTMKRVRLTEKKKSCAAQISRLIKRLTEAFLSEKTDKDGGLGLSLIEGDVIVEIESWDVSSGQ